MTELINIENLEKWIEYNGLDIKSPLRVEKISGGQSNPTFAVHAQNGSFVLRRKPPGVLLKSAHAVDREFRVQSALQGTDIPVAKMVALCQDPAALGADFYIMEMLDGRVFDDPSLRDAPQTDRRAIMDEMNRVLAAIHNVDLDRVGLSDYGPDGNYYQRQVDRWTKQYHASQTETIPDMEDLIAWLGAHIPPDDGQRTLVHGDFRIDNLMFDPRNARCIGVLDWELSTLGHPYADLAGVIMQWGMPNGAETRGLAGIDRAETGLMTDQDFIDLYCERRGLAGIDRFGFYLAFCFFRMAAILQGVKKRALDGNGSDPERGLVLGQWVPEFAKLGMEATKNI